MSIEIISSIIAVAVFGALVFFIVKRKKSKSSNKGGKGTYDESSKQKLK